MCGIVGTYNLTKQHPIEEANLRQMLAMIRHRGPDEFGIYLDSQIGLGNVRLCVIDLTGGQQPITNEDETLWIVYNGEIYNYIELRVDLEIRGHRFTTNTDTEVILHLYEDYGPDCLEYLNGPFAIAIWDTQQHRLFLARDRIGIRPLFYTQRDGALIFGSEIKALLADRRLSAEIDPISLDQVFTFWSPLPPRTILRDIFDLPPGHYMIADDGRVEIHRYWEPEFPTAPATGVRSVDEAAEELRTLLIDATRLRLRADVPVGAYLSGGLDSSTVTALIRTQTSNHLETFSIAFSDPAFDESTHQQRMAQFLGTDHHILYCNHTDIGNAFPDMIWHTEMPMVRTAPVPLFLLSRLVNQHNLKVVLTGEGADEFLGGYNIYKEAKVRRFWAKNPDSSIRPLLLKRLYPYVSNLSSGGGAYLTAFFKERLIDVNAADYSHAIRWRNTGRLKRFFSSELKSALAEYNGSEIEQISLDEDFFDWEPLARAQYLEITIFLSQYLLSAQGDRVAMAHSVEGRMPFLDHRVMEFCNQLPPTFKLRGLKEKYLLKRAVADLLPEEICRRPKRPYRAPIHRSFFNESTPVYVRDLLAPDDVEKRGLFNPRATAHLIKKIEGGIPLGESDDMALVGVLSSQLVHRLFVEDFQLHPPLSDRDNVKVCYGQGITIPA
jgi:asparagine synthase (glutamine-hydrolysing)